MEVTADDMAMMTVEIMKGRKYGDARNRSPMSAAHRAAWDVLAMEIAEIIAEGYEVDVVAEWPAV